MTDTTVTDRQKTPKIRPAQFSLAGILLLTIVVAVAMAVVRSAVVAKNRWGDQCEFVAFCCALGGLIAGPAIGAALGSRRRRPIRGVLVGVVVGLLAACLAVVLLATPASLPVVACGSLLLVGFGSAVRFFSARLASDRRLREPSQSADSGHTDQYG